MSNVFTSVFIYRFVENRLVVEAAKNVLAGEEILSNYGP